MADTQKLVFMVLHGPDHPEHATIPFVTGCAALASDVEVVAAGRFVAEITSATNSLVY